MDFFFLFFSCINPLLSLSCIGTTTDKITVVINRNGKQRAYIWFGREEIVLKAAPAGVLFPGVAQLTVAA